MNPRYYPLLALVALGVVFSIALLGKMVPQSPYPQHPMVGQEFPFPTATGMDEKEFDFSALKGKPFMVNVFASWCPGCKAEHPHLTTLKAKSGLPLVGIAWKDKRIDTALFLAHKGNPYTAVVMDYDGKLALPLGLTGVPETLRVNETGKITHVYKGAVNEKIIEQYLLKDAPL